RLGQKAHIAIVRRVEDVTAFMRQAESLPASMLKLMIIPREMTKLSEGWEAAVVWRRQHIAQWKAGGTRPSYLPEGSQRIVSLERPHCPTCGEVVTRVENGQHVAASKAFLNRTQHYCPACGGAVWQLKRTFSAPKKGQKYPAKNPRYPLADFIAKRYPDRILFYASDEIHELKSTATGQGLAMQRLAGVARYTAGLTGTLYGGTASSLYGLEFTMNPRVRVQYPWAQHGMAKWVKRMGVMEREIEYKPDYDEHGRYTGKRVVEKKPAEAPGCSPELVQEIIDHVVMVGLLDSGREMPDFEEIPVPIPMDSDMQTHYDSTQQELGKYLFQCAMEGDASFMGAYLQGLLSWPTAAFREERFIHRKKLVYTNERGEEVTEIMPQEVAILPGLGTDRVYPKERWLLELLDNELAEGRRVAVYCRQTGTRDIQGRLEELVRAHVPLARPWVMYGDKIAAEKREERLAREVKHGVNVLICNPILVQTGLDLVDFPTIVFFEVNYSIFVMGQAARRAWRIIQDQPCRVYYPHYQDCMEERAVTLVGRKQAAANLLAGQGTGEGLSAFTGGLGGSDGLLSALADNFNDTEKEAGGQIFGKVDVTIDRAASTWLSGIDANPEAFVLPGGTVESIAVPVEKPSGVVSEEPSAAPAYPLSRGDTFTWEGTEYQVDRLDTRYDGSPDLAATPKGGIIARVFRPGEARQILAAAGAAQSETIQPEPPQIELESESSVLAPPEEIFKPKVIKPRRVSHTDLDRAPDDEDPISVPDWPQRERAEHKEEREPEIVQLALF
ncbi:MAG: hypothetical protein JXN59_09690, partial [Anaerolineae bacterium]|nr:hypothetical protein [Anaerolineae bacterium]